MIRYFDTNYRDNWVDTNNNFVGFSNDGHCCEVFGSFWFTYDGNNFAYHNWDNDNNDYLWDTNWSLSNDDRFDWATRIDVDLCDAFNNYNIANLDSGYDCVFFRATDSSGNHVYLALYNHHDGYYSHGWDVGVLNSDGTTSNTNSGSL